MENVSTLGITNGKDVAIPSPFAYVGDIRMPSDSLQSGIEDIFATPTEKGGEIFKRATMNAIGLISTLDLFMSLVGSYASYVNGITYQQTAKLEYFDRNGCMQMDVMAMANSLGDFNSDTSLISRSKWRPMAGSAWKNLYFN